MEFDFDVAEIKVNAATDAWGPYRFSLKWALPNPTGDPLASCTVKSFLNGTETTTDLISSSSMASIGNAWMCGSSTQEPRRRGTYSGIHRDPGGWGSESGRVRVCGGGLNLGLVVNGRPEIRVDVQSVLNFKHKTLQSTRTL
jgi:hypothetical protein